MSLPKYKTPPRTKSAALKRIRKIIAAGWTQGELAKDAHGHSVYPESERAACVCLRGAEIRAKVAETPFYLTHRDMCLPIAIRV